MIYCFCMCGRHGILVDQVHGENGTHAVETESFAEFIAQNKVDADRITEEQKGVVGFIVFVGDIGGIVVVDLTVLLTVGVDRGRGGLAYGGQNTTFGVIVVWKRLIRITEQ